MEIFRNVWKKDWLRLLIIFLLTGSIFVFTEVLSKVFTDQVWASVLGSLPIGLFVMYVIAFKNIQLYSLGHVFANTFEVVVGIGLFCSLYFASPNLQKNSFYVYGMITLAIVLWVVFNVLFGYFAMPKLVKKWNISAPKDISCV